MIGCLIFSNANALDLIFDALSWRALEPIDWAASSNRNPINNRQYYHIIDFSYAPGYRLGLGYSDAWDTRFYYTNYFTSTSNAVTAASVSSGFLAARIALLPVSNGKYTAEQVNFKISYNTFDWDFGKVFQVNSALILHPLIGLRGAMINQTINTNLQGSISVTEDVQNNFRGVGPKLGVDTKIELFSIQNYQVNLLASFVTAYLWGQWHITDLLYHHHSSVSEDIDIDVDDRNAGSLAMQGLLGGTVEHKALSMKMGYEINDWFDQFQVFDNGTGGHSNDLILQGLTFELTYKM